MEDPDLSTSNNNANSSSHVQNVNGNNNLAIANSTLVIATDTVKSLPPSNRIRINKHLKRLSDDIDGQISKKNLRNKVLIELMFQERPDLVYQSLGDSADFPENRREEIPLGTNAIDLFDQENTLLVVGNQGAGRTTTLFRIAESLLNRFRGDSQCPVPVLFDLCHWAELEQDMKSWLIQQLWDWYKIPSSSADLLITDGLLILLLDGLNEVAEQQFITCAKELNKFLQKYDIGIVVCCQIQDYQRIKELLRLRKAICIQPLTKKGVNAYIEQTQCELIALKTLLQADRSLQELSTSLLMLEIMCSVYQDCSSEDIARGGTKKEYSKRLLDGYIDEMFRKEGVQLYSRQDTQQWLIHLARLMSSRTVFSIDQLQPSWLRSRNQKRFYQLISVSFCPLLLGILYGSLFSIPIGVSSGATYMVIIARQDKIKLIETIKHVKENLFNGFFYGLLYGAIFALLLNLIVKMHNWQTILGGIVAFGIVGGMVGSLGALGSPRVEGRKSNSNGFIRSSRNAAISFLTVFIATGVLAYLQFGSHDALRSALTLGTSAGLIGGGDACLQHILLRMVIYFCGYAPMRYARFLDYAKKKKFLEKDGVSYKFTHPMLQNHFAEMPLSQKTKHFCDGIDTKKR
jgi:hypothetical protein